MACGSRGRWVLGVATLLLVAGGAHGSGLAQLNHASPDVPHATTHAQALQPQPTSVAGPAVAVPSFALSATYKCFRWFRSTTTDAYIMCSNKDTDKVRGTLLEVRCERTETPQWAASLRIFSDKPASLRGPPTIPLVMFKASGSSPGDLTPSSAAALHAVCKGYMQVLAATSVVMPSTQENTKEALAKFSSKVADMALTCARESSLRLVFKRMGDKDKEVAIPLDYTVCRDTLRELDALAQKAAENINNVKAGANPILLDSKPKTDVQAATGTATATAATNAQPAPHDGKVEHPKPPAPIIDILPAKDLPHTAAAA